MSRKCIITGKGPQSGNNVSHSKIKTKRKFNPNVHKVKFFSDALKRDITLKVSAHGMRIIDVKGGLDNYIVSLKRSQLCTTTRKLKKEILYNLLYKDQKSENQQMS